MSLISLAVVLIIGIMFQVSPAQAAGEPTTAKYNKTWTIRFSHPVDPESLNGNIYVVDANDKRVNNIELKTEGEKVFVSMNGNHTYAEGLYNLVINDNVCSLDNGERLKEHIIMPFQVMGRNYFTFDDPNMPTGLTGASYSTNLGAGKANDCTWECVPGSSLPDGLSLNSNTGSINGTPSQAGTYTFKIKKTLTKPGTSEEKELTITILPGNYNSYNLTPPNFTPGEQMPWGQAELCYAAGIKKQIEVLWSPPTGDALGSQQFSGYLGGTNLQVQISGNISYLKDVNFTYAYWPSYNWRIVIANVSGAVREVWMDARYKDGKRTRKMDFMKNLSDSAKGNVFGTNTNSLEINNKVTFKLYDAYGKLLETSEMIVQ